MEKQKLCDELGHSILKIKPDSYLMLKKQVENILVWDSHMILQKIFL